MVNFKALVATLIPSRVMVFASIALLIYAVAFTITVWGITSGLIYVANNISVNGANYLAFCFIISPLTYWVASPLYYRYKRIKAEFENKG